MTKKYNIDRPIEELPLSGMVIQQCRRMGFNTLRQVLDSSHDELASHKEFSYHWLEELSAQLPPDNLAGLMASVSGIRKN